MPFILTPTTARVASRDEIRQWMRDFVGGGAPVPGTGVINILLDGVEFADSDIDLAVNMTVDRYNVMTPMTMLSMDLIPKTLLMYGAVGHLLQSESFRQLRNQATVSDADVQPIGIDDKAPAYTQAARLMFEKFDELAKNVKIQRNMESMYGGISSGYRWASGRWGW